MRSIQAWLQVLHRTEEGVPKWREIDDILGEVRIALDAGVRHVRLGGMTDVYTYRAEGVVEMEYPRPDPEPIAALLHGLREDERLDVLHVDNANPSIMAEHPEEAELITRTLVDTLSDGAVLSFGIESADPEVHERNWLNCDPSQLKTAIRMVNRYGRERGPRGLPKLLPGLNFIAGLNGENEGTYRRNLDLLGELMDEDLWLRRINLRQVEDWVPGRGQIRLRRVQGCVRSDVDGPLLERMFPIGTVLKQVHWESHDDRIRRPSDLSSSARDPGIHGEPGRHVRPTDRSVSDPHRGSLSYSVGDARRHHRDRPRRQIDHRGRDGPRSGDSDGSAIPGPCRASAKTA